MSLPRVALLVLLAGGVASAQRPAVRLILPASLDTPRPKTLVLPDPSPRPNDIEIVAPPAPLPALTPAAPTIPVFRLNDQLRAAFPASAVRLGLVGDQLVLTGQAADAGEGAAILELVRAASAGHRVVNRLHVRGQILLHVLAVEVDRRAALAVGLATTNTVGEQGRTAAALAALYSRNQASVLVAQTIPASEGKTAAFSARRCQLTLCADGTSEAVRLAVTARFSPADRCILSQALQTVVELRDGETLVVTNYSAENERDIVLIVTPEIANRQK